MRGAFTTLYRNLTPAVWQSTFRHGENALPVPRLLKRTHGLARRMRPHAAAEARAWASRLCCGLLRREIVQCNLGCAPWRMLSGYSGDGGDGGGGGGGGGRGLSVDSGGGLGFNVSRGRPLPSQDAAACEAAGAGGSLSLWEQPAPRGAESALLHPNKRQTWRNGAMKCDFCEGYFNGWRGW